MSTHKRRTAAFLLSLACWCAGVQAATAQEQTEQPASQARPAPPAAGRDDTNHDVHLYMIVGTNDAAQRGSLPPFMEGVTRQLRSALPFEGYRLASTLVYRVRDGGALEVRGVSGAALTGLPPGTPNNSTFYEFRIQRLRADKTSAGQPFVEVRGFRFGMRLPVVTATVRANNSSGNAQDFPVVNHEETAVATDLTVRAGEPALVSTVTTSRPDEAIILVLLVRQAAK
jgi:hypothetical protein